MLVVEQQGLVAGVEVDGGQLIVLDSTGHHEDQCPLNLRCQRLVPGLDVGVTHEVGIPRMDATQVGEATGGKRPHQVQGRC